MTAEDAARRWNDAANRAEQTNTDEDWLRAHEAFRVWRAANALTKREASS